MLNGSRSRSKGELGMSTAPVTGPAESPATQVIATPARPLGGSLGHGDELVLDYLAELWAASEQLPPDLRDELMRTVTDYVAARRAPGVDPGPVLSRLGPPEQLAEATRRGFLPVHLRLPVPSLSPSPSAEPRVGVVGGVESAVIALLIGGTFLMPVISPAAGMLIATGSPRWTPAQKAAGWVLTAGSAAAAFLAVLLLASLDVSAGPVLLFGYLAACAGSVVAGLSLLAGMRARP